MKKKLYNWLIRNWHWKLLALLAACLFWYAYVNIQDPVVTETMNNVPVTVLNYQQFLDKGKTVEFEDSSLDINNLTLNVTIRARTSVMQEVAERKDQILYVWIDLYELEQDDDRLSIHYEIAQAYKYSFNNVRFVTLSNQSYYTVSVDEDVTKTVPLTYQIVGSPAEGYTYIDDDPATLLTPSEITLTGPADELDEVESAQILASVEGQKANIALSEPIMYYDANGSRVYLSNDVTTSSDTATLYIPIYQVKELPIKANITGEVQEGYTYLNDATVSTESVMVYGQESELKNVEEILLPEISISAYTAAATETFNIDDVLESQYPGGEVRYYSGQRTVDVSFTVAELVTKEIEIPVSQITINGQGERELSYEKETVMLRVSGTQAALDAFDASTIHLTLNLAEVGEGAQQNLPLAVVIPQPSGVVLASGFSASVNVTLTLPVTEESDEQE